MIRFATIEAATITASTVALAALSLAAPAAAVNAPVASLPAAFAPVAFASAAQEPIFPGAEAGWPHWRGPHRTGVAPAGSKVPVEFDAEAIAWELAIPGRGFSTPLLWDGKLFLTTAVPVAEEDVEQDGDAPPAEFHGGGGQYPEQEFLVLCVDARNGELLWEREATRAVPHEGYHKTYGSFASIPIVTDGKVLYCSFGSFGVFAYDLEGEPLWSHDFEVEARMRRQFGEGAAPALADGVLVFNFDQEEQSFAAALDAETGKELWRVERDEPTSWTTPLPLLDQEPAQVVLAATNRIRSYGLSDGELLWECGGLGLNAIPMPLRSGDLLLAQTGYREPNCIAVRLGGEGDLTGGDAVVWSTSENTAYTASPVLHEGTYYFVTDRGQISALDAMTGEVHYSGERLPRGSRLKASPILVGDHLYIATEEGFVNVVPAGPEYSIAGSNRLGEQVFIASPIAVGDSLYLRSEEGLLCIR